MFSSVVAKACSPVIIGLIGLLGLPKMRIHLHVTQPKRILTHPPQFNNGFFQERVKSILVQFWDGEVET